jgi:DNA-binding NarL/FixJ family response regulator
VTIRVVVADDQPLIRSGLVAILGSEPDLEVVGQAEDGRAAVAAARGLRPDVLLMDVRMPLLDGLAATREITADPSLAGVRIVVLTTFEADENVLAALQAGAAGFLGKDVSPAQLVAAVRTVAGGEALLSPRATTALVRTYLQPPAGAAAAAGDPRLDVLTEREREVLAMVGRGLTNDEIAADLVLSTLTVKTHVNRTMTKVGARDRAQLVVLAYRSGLVRPDGP